MDQSLAVPSGAPKHRFPSTVDAHGRIRAAAVHLLLCAAIALAVLGVVYLAWYRDPLDAISGVGEILLIVLSVDVILGPVLTLIVFDRRKKRLGLDLACIGLLQAIALGIGVHAVESGRPHYLVFVKDRFEVVSRADLREGDILAGEGNPAAAVSWFGPQVVAVEMPTSVELRKEIMLESVLGGRDVQHFPALYRPYETAARDVANKALPLSELWRFNPGDEKTLDAAIARTGISKDRLGFVPVKGTSRDGVMLVETSSGALVGMVNLKPWL